MCTCIRQPSIRPRILLRLNDLVMSLAYSAAIPSEYDQSLERFSIGAYDLVVGNFSFPSCDFNFLRSRLVSRHLADKVSGELIGT